MRKIFIITGLLFATVISPAQEADQDSTLIYKKRVLESTEVDFLTSYYSQDGDNAAVSGGIGTEELTDFTPTFVVSIPLNADDVLSIDAGVSAYTSASSSNVNPFDGGKPADPFVASSGASSSDLWANMNASYSHSSDDRNKIWSAKASLSSEFDYFSIGLGGSYTRLFNEKNTELSINANVYLDTWKTIYPYELRPFGKNGNGLSNSLFNDITGDTNYDPIFQEFESKTRNSYSVGLGFSQILSKNLQASLALDVVQQEGLLSTPFQRVYFKDVEDSFIENFQLADAIEQLPETRFKVALGSRLNYFINEIFVVRTYYRYYNDDWGIKSHTASIELPIKITDKFTLYPSYRYYTQTAADYFAPYEEHLSTEEYYTSDYDLSKFNANQYGFGVSYTDIFTKFHIWNFGLKSIDLKFHQYKRNTGLKANMIAGGFKFILD
ncbi:DUF3570 domain-containing protein [Gillisia sp. M10.2A]|uniref:DUF3570 domain-containing protein n=1 Tax=Gillisia lutea TaxID=2909668 RepID=A0ABS9EM18_9FLAO|nr:DUF3570 domain-containing protein [Gillisia lutea]MCF4102528.1 DUF3570 domain-containing protein [Gillisia lutea]